MAKAFNKHRTASLKHRVVGGEFEERSIKIDSMCNYAMSSVEGNKKI